MLSGAARAAPALAAKPQGGHPSRGIPAPRGRPSRSDPFTLLHNRPRRRFTWQPHGLRVAGASRAGSEGDGDHVWIVLRHAVLARADRNDAAQALRALRIRARPWLRSRPVRLARSRSRLRLRSRLRWPRTRPRPPRATLPVRSARHHARPGEGDHAGGSTTCSTPWTAPATSWRPRARIWRRRSAATCSMSRTARGDRSRARSRAKGCRPS